MRSKLFPSSSRRKPGSSVFLFIFFTFSISVHAAVLTGIDVLRKEKFKSLDGSNVALITNQTGVDRRGKSTVDLLHKAKNINLRCILSPEHGFRGTDEHGQKVKDGKDPKTGLTVYSLYGETTRPTDEMLEGVDTIVYDIQDIGTRFYTYITTMGQALEEAAKRNLRFVVLDRPNPIRGDIVEGDILDSDIKRFTGYFTIPVRYGLTIGELAIWMNQTQHLKANLSVIKMKQWKRSQWFDQTHLPFIKPSPNIRDIRAAVLYPGVGCFEATNVSVGRGTDTPFHLFGAPWIDAKALCAHLREQNFSGVLFEAIEFKPKSDLYEGETCEGIHLQVTDRATIRPFRIFLAAFLYLIRTYPQEFKPNWEEIRVVTGSRRLEDAVSDEEISFDTLLSQYDKTLTSFKKHILPFYLYK